MFVGFLKKHKRLLFLGIFLGIIIVTFLPKIIDFLPEPTPKEKIAVIGIPTLSEIPLFIQKQISYGLTEISPSGEATPSAASEFFIEDDGKRFVFKLRQDLFWHDGKPFSAEDVNYNFSDVEVVVNGPYEIVFQLKDPFVPFPAIVSQPLFRQEKSWLFQKEPHLLGMGNMQVVELIKSAQHSHNISSITLSDDNLIRTYRFYNTQESAITAFKLGEVDQILEISSPGELANWPNTKIEENVHFNRYVALFFNYQDDYLSSKSIRQALTYAIPAKPQDDLRAISPINPNSWAYNPQVKKYDYDFQTAKNMLDKEREENQDFNLEIELTTTYPHLKTAEEIKSQWEKLGINTTIKVSSYLPSEIQTLLIAQEIPPDPDQYSLWHSTQSTNLTKYDSPKVDKLLEDGRQTVDKKDRTQIYQDFQRFLVEDSPAAFLYFLKTYNISR